MKKLYIAVIIFFSSVFVAVSAFAQCGIAATPAAPSICIGDSVMLSASDTGAVGVFNWSPATGLSATTGTIVYAKPNTTATYKITKTGCSDSALVTVTVNPLPSATIAGSDSICAGNTTVYNAGTGFASYLWSSSATTQTITLTTAGTYTVTVTNGFGCSATATKSLTVIALPSATIAGSDSICAGNSAVYNAGAGFASYLWSSSATTQTITVTTTGTYTVTVTNGFGCSTTATKSLTVIALPSATIAGSDSICAGNSAVFNAGPGFASYLWSSSATTQTITVTTAGTYTVTVTNGSGCFATATKSLIVTTPHPDSISDKTFCNGDYINGGINFSSSTPGISFNWISNFNIGFGLSDTGSISSFTAANPGIVPIIDNIIVHANANGCSSDTSFSITVNPTPYINTISDTGYCNGDHISGGINFNSSPPGASFSWTGNFDVGFGTSGTGSIPDTNAITNLFYPLTAVIIVSPQLNGCTGPDSLFTVTVNPTPHVDSIASKVYCNGNFVSAIHFTSSSPDSTFYWSNSNTNIGLASSGSDSIPGFTAIDTTQTKKTATIKVVAKANGCTGDTTIFTITVYPDPKVKPVNDTVYCNGETGKKIKFKSAALDSSFAWIATNDVGFGVAGTGSIGTYTAVNNDTIPVTGTIKVVAMANGCSGDTLEFHITVNPKPGVNMVTDTTLCVGDHLQIDFSGMVAGTNYLWTNSNTAIGLGAGDTNTISLTAQNSLNIPLAGNISVVPEFTYSGETCPGDTIKFAIIVNPIPVINSFAGVNLCNKENNPAIIFSSLVDSSIIKWHRMDSTLNLGFGNSGYDSIPAFTAINDSTDTIVDIIVISGIANNCQGPDSLLTITIYPTPRIDSIPNYIYCNGDSITAILLDTLVNGASFSWHGTSDIGFGNADTNKIIPDTIAVNSDSIPVVDTITVVAHYGVCYDSLVFTITVNPTPHANPVNAITLCNGTSVDSIPFHSNIDSSTITWYSKDSIDIGFGVSGTGSIPQFTASDNTDSIVVATIVVNVNANGCIGDSMYFPITVNPTPHIDSVIAVALCNGAIDSISLHSNVDSSTITWYSKDSIEIGFGVSGTGSISQFTASNNTDSIVIDTIVVHVNANGCPGDSIFFTVTVYPTPHIIPFTDTTLCAGTLFIDTLKGNIPGTVYNWTNTNTSIGLASAGFDTFYFTASDTLNAPIFGNIAVVPEFSINGLTCFGDTLKFKITVNPTPHVVPIADTTLCAETLFIYTLNGNITGSVYNWTNSNTSIGLDSAGSDTISFTTKDTLNVPIFGNIEVVPQYSNNGLTCFGDTLKFTITVNPTPALTSADTNSVCDGFAFPYIATSNVTGTAFNWNRDSITGITPGSGSGSSGIINEILHNAADSTIHVTYIFTLTANGCASDTNYILSVKPSPKTKFAPGDTAYCSGVVSNIISFSSSTAVDTFFWSGNNNNNIWLHTPAAGASPAIPADTTVNIGVTPITSTITVHALSVGGCKGPDSTFTITVKPTPPVPHFTSLLADSNSIALCGGSLNINFNVNSAAPGVTYYWSAAPVVIAAIGNTTNPNTVISFANFDTTVTINVVATNSAINGSCTSSVSQIVSVHKSDSAIDERKIFLKQPGNLLIYPDNSMHSYQWGYDKKQIDSTLGPPQDILNQVYQFFIPDAKFLTASQPQQLDTDNYCFWVMLGKGECESKVYYNGPYSKRLIQPEIISDSVGVDVYPNPAGSSLNLSLYGNIYGNINVKFYNTLGQTAYQVSFTKKKPKVTQFIKLPPLSNGIYLLELESSDNQKINARIIIYN